MDVCLGDVGSRSTPSDPDLASNNEQTMDATIRNLECLTLSEADVSHGLNSPTPSAKKTSYSETEARGDGRGLSREVHLGADSSKGSEQLSEAGSHKQRVDHQASSTDIGLRRTELTSQARGIKQQLPAFSARGSSNQMDSKASLKAFGKRLEAATTGLLANTTSNGVHNTHEPHEPRDGWDPDFELLLQPETRPCSHDQLVHEVKGIYAGLIMVEAKCIDVDGKQTAAAREKDPAKRTQLTPEQWSALIALHKTLLHEHHDFFLASQHPSASPALTKLAEKYSMPARMWKHGIHAFLEVLRLRLPGSLDHMLAFIYIAYSMMALLYETVPSFENTWIECLGDLGRYRMAIGDEDVKDRDVWGGVARFWYEKAAEKNPQVRNADFLINGVGRY